MSATEQFFDTDIHHLGVGDCAYPSSEQDMECRQSAIDGRVGEHAQAHG